MTIELHALDALKVASEARNENVSAKRADFFIHFNPLPWCEFQSAARVGPSGDGWPYSGDQGLVTIVGPTVVSSVLPTLAANIGNQRCARPSAQLWPRLKPICRANLGELP